MGEKMTYKQALTRSLIVGGIFSIYMLLIALNIILADILSFLICGCSMWLIMLFSFISTNYYGKGIVFTVSPLIICVLLGSITFLSYRDKKWLTPWKFTFILLGVYLFFNIVSAGFIPLK
ncbi:MAG: hypothetical protein AAB038_02380 [Planctomycetota bacterium]